MCVWESEWRKQDSINSIDNELQCYLNNKTIEARKSSFDSITLSNRIDHHDELRKQIKKKISEINQNDVEEYPEMNLGHYLRRASSLSLLSSMIIRSDLKFIFLLLLLLLLNSLNDTQVGNNYNSLQCSYVYHKKSHDREEEEEKKNTHTHTAHVANILSYLLLIDWQWTRRRSPKKSNCDIISIDSCVFLVFILTSDMRSIHSFIFVHVRSVFDLRKTSIHQQHRWRKWILCDDGVSG